MCIRDRVVAAALIMLVQLGRLDAILAAIIIGRAITISALREWMAQIGAHKSIAVSMIGKIKTVAQMLAIPLLLYHSPISGLEAVSYTHLDVYKRQAYSGAVRAGHGNPIPRPRRSDILG